MKKVLSVSTAILLVFLVHGALAAQRTANRISPSAAQVPFVGCSGDGQAGPIEAPKTTNSNVRLDARAAARLALYKASIGPAVLAPRGWACFAVYGSSGSTLYVTPAQLRAADGVNPRHEEIPGPVVQASVVSGYGCQRCS